MFFCCGTLIVEIRASPNEQLKTTKHNPMRWQSR
jgi:hypothetical protein